MLPFVCKVLDRLTEVFDLIDERRVTVPEEVFRYLGIDADTEEAVGMVRREQGWGRRGRRRRRRKEEEEEVYVCV